jgi:RimJ/RimL family protein N-acetyltransferase
LTAEIRTARLLLRRWRPEDREPYAALSADAQVMEHYPSVLSRAQADARVDEIEAEFARVGFGRWAVEIPGPRIRDRGRPCGDGGRVRAAGVEGNCRFYSAREHPVTTRVGKTRDEIFL